MTRATEYEQAGIAACWLTSVKASHAYEYALRYSDPARYGLHKERVSEIECLTISNYSAADAWLKARFPQDGTVQVVYGESEVAVLDTHRFLEQWLNILGPGRDDAIVLHNLSATVMFYCHEDEIEVGQRLDLLSGNQ